jgi:hypothetical protein
VKVFEKVRDFCGITRNDKRWLAYLRAHVGNLELLPAIVTHWERTAKPITRPLKVAELCKAFVLYREGKGLDRFHPHSLATPWPDRRTVGDEP